MQESKDAQWFKKKQRDQERVNKEYNSVRKWQVAPKTFEATEAHMVEEILRVTQGT